MNILLITSDQHHWNALGINNPEVCTPNLDKLAKEGTVYDRAYTVNPTCTPARASIITGQYPSQHGAWSLGTKLPDDAHTVGDDFKTAGFKSALVGKAHFQPLASTVAYKSLEAYPILQDLDFWRSFHGPFYGFDQVELARNHTDDPHVGQHYAIWMEEKGLENWREHFATRGDSGSRQKHTWSLPEEYHYNTWIAEKSNAILTECADKKEKFFLWASFFDPHPSYLVPEPWDKMYDPAKVTVPSIQEGEHANNPPHFAMTQEESPDFSSYAEPDGNFLHGCHSHLRDKKSLAKDIAIYYGMVSCMDKYIGKILDTLEELGLKEDTMVVFTTDHGHFFGHHGLQHKGPFHYEDMIKIPFIVSCPGTVPQDKRSNALQSIVDLPVTFLKLNDIPVPRTMTGLDQSAVWKGEKAAVRDHVLIENRHNPTTLFHKTYINDRYKITVYYNQPYGELFDLQADPSEVNNLWDHPGSARLKSELLLKLTHADMGIEPLWMPRIEGA